MKYGLLMMMLIMFACSKEKSCENCIPASVQEVTATVLYQGPIGADGCEWVIQVNNRFYHPRTLAAEFQQSGLQVIISFLEQADRFRCGFNPANGIPVIELTSIRK